MTFNTIRLVCSGGRRRNHPVRELFILHRRRSRLDLASLRPVTSDWPDVNSEEGPVVMEVPAVAEKFEPGWGVGTSMVEFSGRQRRSYKKTPVVMTETEDGDQLFTVPTCPACNRGGNGLKLSARRLEQATEALNRSDVDLSLFVS